MLQSLTFSRDIHTDKNNVGYSSVRLMGLDDFHPAIDILYSLPIPFDDVEGTGLNDAFDNSRICQHRQLRNWSNSVE